MGERGRRAGERGGWPRGVERGREGRGEMGPGRGGGGNFPPSLVPVPSFPRGEVLRLDFRKRERREWWREL